MSTNNIAEKAYINKKAVGIKQNLANQQTWVYLFKHRRVSIYINKLIMISQISQERTIPSILTKFSNLSCRIVWSMVSKSPLAQSKQEDTSLIRDHHCLCAMMTDTFHDCYSFVGMSRSAVLQPFLRWK